MASRKENVMAGAKATDRRLRLQLAIFSLVFLVVAVLVIVRVINTSIDPMGPVLGFAAGLVVGIVLARGRKISWDAPDSAVISSMSVFGIVVTAAYVIMKLLPENLVSRLVSNPETAGIVSLAVTAGIMLGRTLFTFRTIRRTLLGAGVVEHPHGS